MSTFSQQLKALLKRNFLLKKRIKKHTFQEFFWPVYFVLILGVMNVSIPLNESPAIPSFPEYNFSNESFAPKGRLLVSPNSTAIRLLMDDVVEQFNEKSRPHVELFASPEDLEQAYLNNDTFIAAGINFVDENLSNLSYTIRMRHDIVPPSEPSLVAQDKCRGGDGLDFGIWNCPVNVYLYSGFGRLQMAIDTSLTRLTTSNPDLHPPELTIQMMPKASHRSDINSMQILSSIYYVMAYAPFIASLGIYLVAEKEKKIKESMKMMGLRDSAFWISWTLVYSVIILVATAVIVVLAVAFGLFHGMNLLTFFILLYCYGLSIINMAFVFTPFFTKAETAGVLGLATMVFSLLYLAVSLTREEGAGQAPVSSIPAAAQWALSLLSPVALALGIDQLVYQDMFGGSDSNRWDIGQFPVYASLIMLLVDTILYGFLAFWLDNVVPNEYGLKRPAWFCFLPSYWCPKPKNVDEMASMLEHEQNGSVGTNMPRNAPDVEPAPANLRNKDVLRIYNISKTFKSKEKKEIKAVDGISLDIYEGQITALLGHNGAGKTTLINLLTGMSPPTTGTAVIYGLDVSDSNDMTTLRRMTGVCPQANVLFDDLTCREHLEVYAALRGLESVKINKEIERVIADVDMTDQIDTWAKDLSGGQKRKLSVAVALIGDPKIVYLDEPTAGMDPSSRRHLWSLLKAKKANRLILLTTHFMDEADILADRKAFISHGQLRCSGSSLFLKNKFGLGYHLSLVVEALADEGAIADLVQQQIGEDMPHRRHGKELVFTLPLQSVSRFKDIFSALEATLGEQTVAESLGIKTYGVSMTTLEEVFLKLETDEICENDDEGGGFVNMTITEPVTSPPLHVSMEETNGNATTQVNIGPPPLDDIKPDDFEQDSGSLECRRLSALMKIRFLVAVRNKPLLFFRTIFPAIFILIGAWLSTDVANITIQQPTSFALDPSIYLQRPGVDIPGLSKLAYALNPGGQSGPDFINKLQERGIDTDHLSNINNTQSSWYTLAYDIYDVDINTTNATTRLAMHYNDTAVHILPVSITMITSAVLKLLKPAADLIQVFSLRFPNPGGEPPGYNNGMFIGTLLLGMGMAVLPAGFAIFLIIERERKIRGQLRIAGVTQVVYWGSAFITDLAQYSITAILSIVALLVFRMESIMHGGAILCIILLYLLYMPVNILLAYCLSFAFDKYETAQAVLGNGFTFLGLVPYIAVSMLDMILADSNISVILHIVFLFIDPAYGIFGGLYYINKVYQTAVLTSATKPDISVSAYFAWNANIIIVFIASVLHIGLLFLLLCVIEVRSTGGDARDVLMCGKVGQSRVATIPADNNDLPAEEDEDVAEERRRVEALNPDQTDQTKHPVGIVKNLRKEFVKSGSNSCGKQEAEKRKIAVRNNTFAVDAGEVFGLLGPNGAGKSTTLNMMMAEVAPTKGRVYVAGYDIRSSVSQAFQYMSSCPQHDALYDDITLKEHIELYATLSGLSKAKIDTVAEFYLESLKITEHAKKIAKTLSGGTKRKTSYAISMMGQPRIVLLDEPSTGMDPKSKRFLWDTISSSFNNDQRGAILTTHYMEEADALCNRVGIMVNGQMECLGTPQHLKNKFGNGYILEVKLKVDDQSEEKLDSDMKSLTTFVKENFPESVQVERFGERIIFRIPSDGIQSLAYTFTCLEDGKQQMNIEEYSFSQATLEQVFLEFARHQLDDGEEISDEKQEAAQRTRANLRRQLSDQSGELHQF